MTSIGAIGAASHLASTTAVQGGGSPGGAIQGLQRHHHRQASAADPDGDGDPSAAPASRASASPAAALSQALNTTA
ncbi:MAG: hypothetical protein KGK10_11435 [Rhodospirillales bacterium]|nr:hypothetical protein [Rhodospirillales bacterium]